MARAHDDRRGSWVDSLTCEARWPQAVCEEYMNEWKQRIRDAGLGWLLKSGQFDTPL